MRPSTSPSSVPRRQLAKWHLPLDEDPAVEEAVLRMLKSLDRYLEREPHPKEYETCR